MTEKEALEKFYNCTAADDLEGALAALKSVSAETLNERDGDDYDMLIQSTVDGDECAVEALLRDNRCDVTHEENLCGMKASDFARGCPEGSRIRRAFETAPLPRYIFRDGKLIDRGDIYDLITEGTLEPDEGCLAMLSDYECARLLAGGKIGREDFEKRVDPRELHWEGQIALLIGDEEYGKRFVDWAYIRGAAEPDEWLSFLRDLPQYAHEADWEKLMREGSPEAWRKLLEVRPALAERCHPELLRLLGKAEEAKA